MLALSPETVSPMELQTIADGALQRRLRAKQGFAHVEVFGGEIRQYQVLVHPEWLQKYRLSLDDVVATAGNASGFGAAGYVFQVRLPTAGAVRMVWVAFVAAEQLTAK